MPINSTLDVVVQQDDLVVLGPPSAIDIAIDVGPEGDPGSQIYVGGQDPNTLSSSQFQSTYGQLPQYRDIFISNEAGNSYGTFYQYVASTGVDQWDSVLNISDAVDLFFDLNTDYVISASSGGTGIDNGLRTLAFAGNINFASPYNITLNSTANSNITLPVSGSVAVLQNKLSSFAATTPTELASVITQNTGSGSLVFNTSPTLISPIINTSLDTLNTTINLFNSNATTINFGGAATTIEIGSSTGTTTVNNVLTVDGIINANAGMIGNVQGVLIGNADTATALQTSRVISLGGDLSGSASFNGTSDITISATIVADSVALGTDTTGDYVQSVGITGTGLSVSGTGEGATVVIENTGVTSLTGTTDEVDVSASAGAVTLSLPSSINADTTGNSATSTKLATARVITISGAVSGSAIFDGSSDINIVVA